MLKAPLKTNSRYEEVEEEEDEEDEVEEPVKVEDTTKTPVISLPQGRVQQPTSGRTYAKYYDLVESEEEEEEVKTVLAGSLKVAQ